MPGGAGLAPLLHIVAVSRSGDYLAGIGAATAQQRMAARHVLAETPLKQFLTEALIPYEADNITRLIIDGHDAAAFAPVAHLTVGDFRNWLLSDHADSAALSALAPGLTSRCGCSPTTRPTTCAASPPPRSTAC